MALQSQTLRGASTSRTSMAAPRRGASAAGGGRAAKVLTAAAVLGVVGAGSWYLYTHRADAAPLGPRAASAEPAAPATPAIVEPDAAPASQAAAPQPEPAPQYDVLEMAPRPRVAAAGGPGHQPARPNFATTPASGPTLLGPAAAMTTEPLPGASTPAPTPGGPRASTLPQASPAGPRPAPAPAAAPVRDPLATPAGPQTAPPSAAPMPATPAQPAAAGEHGGPLPAEIAAYAQLADRLMAEKKPVEARAQLNRIVTDARLSDAQRDPYRRRMAELNNDLVFSATAYPGDPMVETYQVAKGDNFIKISQRLNTVTEAGLIQRVSGASPKTLRVGQPLKIVRGPFHAVVSKSAFRMDVYWGPTVSPGSIGQSNLGGGAEPGWVYIRSFPVGLGEKGTTPIGAFTLKERSKLVNPPWVNPRTGEKFDKDDPKNPIGERWMGLVGLDEKTKSYQGYGIHGTIVPESVGQEMSMGCVRMASADVELVYELLMERVSIVKIVP